DREVVHVAAAGRVARAPAPRLRGAGIAAAGTSSSSASGEPWPALEGARPRRPAGHRLKSHPRLLSAAPRAARSALPKPPNSPASTEARFGDGARRGRSLAPRDDRRGGLGPADTNVAPATGAAPSRRPDESSEANMRQEPEPFVSGPPPALNWRDRRNTRMQGELGSPPSP